MIIRNIDHVSKFLRKNLKRGGGDVAPVEPISYPINTVRSPFDSADFLYWLERGKNFANTNHGDLPLLTSAPAGTGWQNPVLRLASGSYGLLSASSSFNFNQDRSIAMWLWHGSTSASTYSVCLTKDSTSGSGREYVFGYNNAGMTFLVINTFSNVILNLSSATTSNTWEFWIINYINSTGVFSLYKNTVLQSSGTVSGTYNVSSTNIHLGQFAPPSLPTSSNPDGYLSQLILCNRALTTTEIATLYNSGSGYFTI